MTDVATIRAWAPGRVNLIGEHTDYTGGLVLPMAIQLGTEIRGTTASTEIHLTSAELPGDVRFALPISAGDAARVEPTWGRHVAGVAAAAGSTVGVTGRVSSTVPLGSGLSSSAALEVAAAVALGVAGTPVEVAELCQRGSQLGTGVPCGIMDQLASAAGVAEHALRIDCTTLEVEPVRLPDDVEVVVVDSGERRQLATSAYAERAGACQAAQAQIGPLRAASLDDLASLADPLVRRRARHVVTENARVDELADALASGDRAAMAGAMAASHRSLRDDFEVSTEVLDALVDRLGALDGVIGARLTGAGFGGCVVSLVERGAPLPVDLTTWRVTAAAGARILDDPTGSRP